jgi:dienelactone hydrolase
VLVRRAPSGEVADVTPPPFDVRSRVHEYGGRAYAVRGDEVFFVDFVEQRLCRQRLGEAPRPLGPANEWRLADLAIDRGRSRLLAVGERHAPELREPENAIVAVDLDGRLRVLVRGADFYACPRTSPDGGTLAFLSWNHPHMPWDAAALHVADLDASGAASAPRHVAGDARASTFQPGFGADGALFFAFEPDGFWNLFRLAGDGPVNLAPMAAEVGTALWQVGASTWDFLDEHTILAIVNERGACRLERLDLRTGAMARVATAGTDIDHLACRRGHAVTLEGSATRPQSVVLHDVTRGTSAVLRTSITLELDPECVSPPEPIVFDTTDGDVAHAFFYAPRNPEAAPLPGERPPLLVTAHGGPTGAAAPTLALGVQFWTTRGFAVLDVDYRGSVGYGRRYRDRLRGKWGVYDVDDCVAGAASLAAAGRVDGRRLAIRGGSAGGYTTLAALAFRDAFRAGASHYGIGDLEALARDTHKFESRYLDGLVGPYPERRDVYLERSPLAHADRLSCPVIFFQGLEDKVVPPSQAEQMVEALRAKGVPVEYHAFEGEQHGFRKADTIRRVYEAELAFYGRVFGFTPAR